MIAKRTAQKNLQPTESRWWIFPKGRRCNGRQNTEDKCVDIWTFGKLSRGMIKLMTGSGGTTAR